MENIIKFLSTISVDLFIKHITYLPFNYVDIICKIDQFKKYSVNPKYNNNWKKLIDDTFSFLPNYNDKLDNFFPNLSYNYIVYVGLINYFDPISQLMIYYRQNDMDSFVNKFNNDKNNKKYKYLAMFLLGKKDIIMDYLPGEEYLPFVTMLNGEKIEQIIKSNMLIEMSMHGNLLGVKIFLSIGAGIRHRNNLAIREASTNGHTEIVKILLDYGADIHADGEYALRYSIKYNHVELVKLLLDYGADIHAHDDHVLRVTSDYGYTELAKILLDYGANVHADNDYALRWSSYHGHKDVVQLLLEYGANIHADNDYALLIASEKGYEEIVKILLNSGADVHARSNLSLRTGITRGHVQIVKLLLNHGANINAL